MLKCEINSNRDRWLKIFCLVSNLIDTLIIFPKTDNKQEQIREQNILNDSFKQV